MKFTKSRSGNKSKIIAVHEAANKILHQSYINTIFTSLSYLQILIKYFTSIIFNRPVGLRLRK